SPPGQQQRNLIPAFSLPLPKLLIMDDKNLERVKKMSFASVYPLYITKVEKKGRTIEELHEVIFWLTGYNEKSLQKLIDNKIDFEAFFDKAPKFNPNASKITGLICGYRVEEI